MDHDKKMKSIDMRIDEYRFKIKDSSDLKAESGVFDTPTLKTLYTLANKGIITAMGGVVSTGKEADVFHAIGENGRELAIKIYRINTSDFQKMQDYLIGDPRFFKRARDEKGHSVRLDKKEQRNLERAAEVGVRVPGPITSERNILIMEFIGKDGVSAPRLKDVRLEEPQMIYETVADYMRRLYQKARLVHGDLSEYNILLYEERPVIIDMGRRSCWSTPWRENF